MGWASTALAEAGCQLLEVILAREDQADADLRAYYMCPDVAASCCLEMEEGTRWPYPRAHALRWERGHPGPRSAATPEELWREIVVKSALTRRIERLECDLMPQQSGPCFVMAFDDAAAEREIERLQAEFGERLPKTLFVMTLADCKDRDH